MKDKTPDFMVDATNVYRTKYFIVKQTIAIQYDCKETNVVYSRDTYYERTKKRDTEYEAIFCRKKKIDGKRLPTSMYTRNYVR